jgi:hypothetical protein
VVARGGVFEEVEVEEHGDAAGGVLIRGAARTAGPRGDMARAVARQAAPTARFSGKEDLSSTNRARMRAGGGG